MNSIFHLNLSNLCCKTTRSVLAVCWCVGLLFGIFVSLSAGDFLASTMHAALSGSLSIFGLLTVILLPFLLSALAVSISMPILLIPIVFLKAFLFAFTGMGILTAFYAARWVLAGLLLFCDTLTQPLLWWFWLHAIPNGGSFLLRRALICVIGTVLVGLFDFYFVAPFLANLISFQKG